MIFCLCKYIENDKRILKISSVWMNFLLSNASAQFVKLLKLCNFFLNFLALQNMYILIRCLWPKWKFSSTKCMKSFIHSHKKFMTTVAKPLEIVTNWKCRRKRKHANTNWIWHIDCCYDAMATGIRFLARWILT